MGRRRRHSAERAGAQAAKVEGSILFLYCCCAGSSLPNEAAAAAAAAGCTLLCEFGHRTTICPQSASYTCTPREPAASELTRLPLSERHWGWLAPNSATLFSKNLPIGRPDRASGNELGRAARGKTLAAACSASQRVRVCGWPPQCVCA